MKEQKYFSEVLLHNSFLAGCLTKSCRAKCNVSMQYYYCCITPAAHRAPFHQTGGLPASIEASYHQARA